MRQDKLTAKFQAALADAQSLALGRDHQMIEPAHLMLALLDSAGGTVRPLLMKAGADVNKLRSELGALLDKMPKVEGTPAQLNRQSTLPLMPSAAASIEAGSRRSMDVNEARSNAQRL